MKKLLVVSSLLMILIFICLLNILPQKAEAVDSYEINNCPNVYEEKTTQEVIVSDRIFLCQDDDILSCSLKIDNDPYYNVTDEERELLARLVFLESSICSDTCQKAVASVIFNRLETGKWGTTLVDVIYYPNAFSPAKYIYCTIPDSDAYAAVDYVIQNGPTLPTYVRYFRTCYDFNWEGYSGYMNIDNMYFGFLNDWKNGAW